MNTYKQGIIDTLSELADIFEGIKETDLWAEYMAEEEGN